MDSFSLPSVSMLLFSRSNRTRVGGIFVLSFRIFFNLQFTEQYCHLLQITINFSCLGFLFYEMRLSLVVCEQRMLLASLVSSILVAWFFSAFAIFSL